NHHHLEKVPHLGRSRKAFDLAADALAHVLARLLAERASTFQKAHGKEKVALRRKRDFKVMGPCHLRKRGEIDVRCKVRFAGVVQHTVELVAAYRLQRVADTSLQMTIVS